jgi:hypothetical protein
LRDFEISLNVLLTHSIFCEILWNSVRMHFYDLRNVCDEWFFRREREDSSFSSGVSQH